MIKSLIVLALSVGLVFPQSALQKRLIKEREDRAKQEVNAILKDLEERLRRLEEEKKRLEELRRAPTPQREDTSHEVKKLVDIFNKTSPDEAGAIMNNLEPALAAEILLNLKERQAAAILEAMDPQRAAEVSRIILERKRRR